MGIGALSLFLIGNVSIISALCPASCSILASGVLTRARFQQFNTPDLGVDCQRPESTERVTSIDGYDARLSVFLFVELAGNKRAVRTDF
jgi:hypothetical protein